MFQYLPEHEFRQGPPRIEAGGLETLFDVAKAYPLAGPETAIADLRCDLISQHAWHFSSNFGHTASLHHVSHHTQEHASLYLAWPQICVIRFAHKCAEYLNGCDFNHGARIARRRDVRLRQDHGLLLPRRSPIQFLPVYSAHRP